MNWFRLIIVVAVALAGACNTAPEKPDTSTAGVAVEDDAHRVRVVPPGALKNQPPTKDDHALFFTDRARDIGLAVVLDEPPQALATLTESVLVNAEGGVESMNVLHSTEAILGGLPARRIEFVFALPGGGQGYFINLHTSTQANNVQVAVWGDEKVRDVIREAADAMEGGGFAFTTPVTPFIATAETAVQVDWPSLPLLVDAPALASWQTLPHGQLNPAAFLELTHKKRELWFLAIETKVSDLKGQSFEDLARIMHTQMSLDMQALPPTNLGVFDEIGTESDRRWSLTGIFTESQTPILHRFRLIMTNERVLQLYCWGNATDNVDAQCNALYDAMAARDAAPTDSPPSAEAE